MISRRLFSALFAGALLLPVAARAADGFVDGLRYVFVSGQDSTRVAVIDSRDDTLAGSLELGLVPSQLEIAGEQGKLAAVDGASARLALVAVDGGEAGMVALDFVPTRLLAAGGRIVAAAPASGWLAVVDVTVGKVVAQGHVSPFRDLQPAGDGSRLLLAPETGEGLVLVDTSTLAVTAELAPPRPGLGGFSSLSRSPSGRVIYARAAGAPLVLAVDVAGGKMGGELAVGAGMARAYTNATGITLVLPDSAERSVALVPASLRGGVSLPGEAGVTGVYSGWFDTVAFIPSSDSRSVMVVDQPGAYRGDDIVLGARPGRGTVTPDGRKFYLPLVDANRVAVISAETRRLSGYVALPFQPSMALMARTFGICH